MIKVQTAINIILLAISIIFISSCSDNIDNEHPLTINEHSKALELSEQFYRKKISKKEFKSAGVFTKDYLFDNQKELIQLVFHPDDFLLSPEAYNFIADKHLDEYGLTLNQKVSEAEDQGIDPDSKEFEAIAIELLNEFENTQEDFNNLEYYLVDLDYFRKYFLENEQIIQLLENRIETSEVRNLIDIYEEDLSDIQSINITNKKAGVSWYNRGNILVGGWNNGGIAQFFGHTGGVYESPTINGNTSLKMANTLVVEASNRNQNPWWFWTNIQEGTTNGVQMRYMTSGNDGWNHSSVYARHALWYPNMSSYRRYLVARYMNWQVGERYQFPSSKLVANRWYCSKLQWRAYKYALAVDIDRNKGTSVYPNDLLYSNKLYALSF